MALVLWLIVLSECVWKSGTCRHEVIKLPLAPEMPLKLLNWAAWLCQRELVKNIWTQKQWLPLSRSKEDCVPDLQLSLNPIPTLQNPDQINPLVPRDLINQVWALALHPRKPRSTWLLPSTSLSLKKALMSVCSSSSGPDAGWGEVILSRHRTRKRRESLSSRHTSFAWAMPPSCALCSTKKQTTDTPCWVGVHSLKAGTDTAWQQSAFGMGQAL